MLLLDSNLLYLFSRYHKTAYHNDFSWRTDLDDMAESEAPADDQDSAAMKGDLHAATTSLQELRIGDDPDEEDMSNSSSNKLPTDDTAGETAPKPSAAQRVFGIPELLEKILLGLENEVPKQTDCAECVRTAPLIQLFALRRVDRTWQDVINGSQVLVSRMTTPRQQSCHGDPDHQKAELYAKRFCKCLSRRVRMEEPRYAAALDAAIGPRPSKNVPRLTIHVLVDYNDQQILRSWRQMKVNAQYGSGRCVAIEYMYKRQKLLEVHHHMPVYHTDHSTTWGELFDWWDKEPQRLR